MAKRRTDHISTVNELDLYRFEGSWFEIARLPVPFASDWVGTTDTYIRLDDRRFRVLYEGRKGSLEGPYRKMQQRLRIPDHRKPGELRVSFIPLVWLPYRLIYLSTDYRAIMITSSSINLLWIMAREPRLENRFYSHMVDTAAGLGFDTSRLYVVPQYHT